MRQKVLPGRFELEGMAPHGKDKGSGVHPPRLLKRALDPGDIGPITLEEFSHSVRVSDFDIAVAPHHGHRGKRPAGKHLAVAPSSLAQA
jgi:hypothetical protein